MISTIVKTVLLLCTLGAMSVAFAQSVIERSSKPYIEQSANQTGVSPVPVLAPPAAISPQQWDVFAEDQKLSRAISRWTQKEGIQFFWEAPKDLVAVKASYYGSYAKAISDLMLDTPASGYPLHACRYDNSIRILHTSQTCPVK